MSFFENQAATFQDLLSRLKGERVAVLGHMRPDGDCVGSQVGLCRALNEIGIEAVAVNQDPVPRNLQSFIGDTPWLKVDDFTPEGHLCIQVDCADELRVGKRLKALLPQTLANIDHHISNTNYGAINLIEAQSSATAEILAGLFLDKGIKVDAITAQALYVGIATDTGQFRFPSTSPKVFDICSRLIACGANPSEAAQTLYENETFNKLELLQRFLGSLTLEFQGRVCIGKLPACVYAETGAKREDAEGLVDYARSIAGVDIGVLIEEREGGIKCSLRAKVERYRVDRLAQVFSGGGHACAAGLSQEDTDIDDFYPKMIEALQSHLASVD